MAGLGRRTVLVAALGLGLGLGSPCAARAQSTPPLSRVPGSVLVHIESPGPVDLERETGDRRDPFYVACTSPCDEWVPATGKYRVAGDGTRESRRFELLASGGREKLVVSPASNAAFAVGVAGVLLGSLAAGVGVFGVFAASLPSDDPGGSSDAGPLHVALGLIAGGVVVGAGGLVLTLANFRSRVAQTTALGARAGAVGSLRSPPQGPSPSDVIERGTPFPRHPPAVGWPLLRLAF